MKRFKKLLSYLMMIIMVTFLFSGGKQKVFAMDENLSNGTFKYYIVSPGDYDWVNNKDYDNYYVIITDYLGTEAEVKIPSSIDGKEVKGIESFLTGTSDNYWEQMNSITSIEIPDTVTSIYGNQFVHCNGLKEIKVDKNNKNYTAQDGVLFNKDMSALIAFPKNKRNFCYTIPDSVASIGDYAFSGCDLESIKIPNSVKSIGNSAFYNCESLKNIIIPSSVTTIGDYAFSRAFGNFETSVNIEIPNSVTSIGESAFYNNSCLVSVTIPDSVTSMGYNAFALCGLRSATILAKSIGSYAFSDCSSLESITIKSSVISIENGAFDGCSSVTNIIIPDSVASIGDYAFNKCSNLTNISVDKNNKNYVDEEGILFSKNKNLLIKYPEGKKDKSYEIPDTVTSIGNYAFEDCSSLASVIIPNSVTSIGTCAFYGCNNLTIYGYKNSYAETYANKNSIPFKELTVQNLNIESFTTDKTSPQVSGTAVTLTTKANGEGALQYKYYKYLNGNYSLIKDWSSSSSITITPSIAGKYDLWVGVKDESGKIVRKNIEFEFKKVLTIDSFTADKTSPQPVNTEVILKTNVSGATGIVQYKYYKYLNGKYSLIKDWSNNSSIKIAPSIAGKYDLWVGVKDESGKTVRKNIEFEFKKALTINSFTTDKISPQPVNTEVILKTNVSGATGTVEYKYYSYLKGNYTLVKDWSNNSSITIIPTTIGTYDLWVAVKDSTGKIVRKSMKYIIKEQPLKIDSFTTDKISPQEIGTSIKLTVQASGGKGKLQYKFRVGDKDGNYLVIQKFSTNNTATWNADYSGDVIFYVDVEDESGRGVTKAINYAIKEK